MPVVCVLLVRSQYYRDLSRSDAKVSYSSDWQSCSIGRRSTVQYSTVQYSTVQYSTVLLCTVLQYPSTGKLGPSVGSFSEGR